MSGTLTDALGIAVTLIVGVATIVFAYGFRRQLRVRIAEKRIGAYGELWGLTYPARPSRWMHEREVITEDERRTLWEEMSKWYFRAGNGMLMPDPTRSLYFMVKDNLIADLDEVVPLLARERLAGLTGDRQAWERGRLAMDQLSLLRTQMKADLDIYGRHYGEPPGPVDEALLCLAGIDPRRPPWRVRHGPLDRLDPRSRRHPRPLDAGRTR